jgi:hypothetical protein
MLWDWTVIYQKLPTPNTRRCARGRSFARWSSCGRRATQHTQRYGAATTTAPQSAKLCKWRVVDAHHTASVCKNRLTITAIPQADEAEAEAMRMIRVYEDAATQLAAIPVIAGA